MGVLIYPRRSVTTFAKPASVARHKDFVVKGVAEDAARSSAARMRRLKSNYFLALSCFSIPKKVKKKGYEQQRFWFHAPSTGQISS